MNLLTPGDARLRKHADYQRVYKRSRKYFSTSMTYFFVERSLLAHATARAEDNPSPSPRQIAGPRVGLTAGRVLGKAVDRNRIKRRMREVVRLNLALLTRDVDVILHPRRTVMASEFTGLQKEVAKIFSIIQKSAANSTTPRQHAAVPPHA